MRSLLLAAPLAFAIGCPTQEAPPIKTDFPNPPALAENTIELKMPEIDIEPGVDVTWCYVSDFVPETDMIVKRAVGYQGSSGHHVVVFQSGIPRQPGTLFDCTNLETMVSMLPLVIPDQGDVRMLPETMGVRVPAGAAIVLQAHIINANIEPIRVADVIHLEVAPADAELVEASYWTISDNELTVPPGISTRSKTCDITEETKLVFLLGHMHETGKTIIVTRERDGVVDELYRVDEWTAEFRDQGPTFSFPADEPLIFAAGDRITLTCEWDNDGEEIGWPGEMCVTLGAYFPSRGGFLDCDSPLVP